MIEPSVGRQHKWYQYRWTWIGAALLAAALLVVLWAVSLLGPRDSRSNQEAYVKVSRGESASQVGSQLQKDGLIKSALAFDWLSRYNGVATHLTAGVYRLSPRDSLGAIMSAMRQGRVVVINVSIPEGYTVKEIAERLVRAHIGTPAQFRRLEQHPLPGMPQPAAGVRDPLEGYLFPATYSFSYGTTARQALEMMWQTFQERVISGVYSHAHTSLSLVQWVTLASILEEEVKDPGQAPDAAAVFLNRYKLGMPFQSDATVKYAVGGLPPGGLTPSNFKNPSPYNTYQHVGFPPGPISNPGSAMLRAALHPASVPYLYFVSLRSGKLLFATTFTGQLSNIQYAQSHPNG